MDSRNIAPIAFALSVIEVLQSHYRQKSANLLERGRYYETVFLLQLCKGLTISTGCTKRIDIYSLWESNQTIMSKKQFIWERQPQEVEGTYRFDGQFLVTRGVQALLSKNEIHAIYFYICSLVDQYDGLDYLQSWVHRETGQKLFFIDQINDEMKKEHPPEHNHCTLMLAEEY